ncbi:hypothetical protein PhCBS80983_g03256 [Powellomyces hirtus]|uniref:Uncharacterized protein n=1 Tax=Powellomyces hirtus TaxID=109895 RepID=A0A507E321_9FUNG|nr:hypothetical protein PhCBS80983_g03256 [Powellomyces hirtus]
MQAQSFDRMLEHYSDGITCLPGALVIIRYSAFKQVAETYFGDDIKTQLGGGFPPFSPWRGSVSHVFAAEGGAENPYVAVFWAKLTTVFSRFTISNEIPLFTSWALWERHTFLLILKRAEVFTRGLNWLIFVFFFDSFLHDEKYPAMFYIGIFAIKLHRFKIIVAWPFFFTWGQSRVANEKAELEELKATEHYNEEATAAAPQVVLEVNRKVGREVYKPEHVVVSMVTVLTGQASDSLGFNWESPPSPILKDLTSRNGKFSVQHDPRAGIPGSVQHDWGLTAGIGPSRRASRDWTRRSLMGGQDLRLRSPTAQDPEGGLSLLRSEGDVETGPSIFVDVPRAEILRFERRASHEIALKVFSSECGNLVRSYCSKKQSLLPIPVKAAQ